MRSKYFFLACFLLILLLAPQVFADQRSYVWTYEYKTVERGKAELENYFTISTPDIEEFEGKTNAEHRVELEVGMTNNFDFAIYQIFEQPANGNFRYKRYQLRARYKIGEKGQLPLDPLIYFEYKGKPDFSEHGIEFKLVLAKDIGKLNFALNPVLEFGRKNDEWETKTGYAAGLTYKCIGELLSVGLEAKGSKNGHYIGPTVSHGEKELWIAVGTLFGYAEIAEGKPEFQMRMLLGIGF